jgi:hypothetical protein
MSKWVGIRDRRCSYCGRKCWDTGFAYTCSFCGISWNSKDRSLLNIRHLDFDGRGIRWYRVSEGCLVILE